MYQRAKRSWADDRSTTTVTTVATAAIAITLTSTTPFIIIGWVVWILFGESQRAASVIIIATTKLELTSEFPFLPSLFFVRNLLSVFILLFIIRIIFVVIIFIRVLHGCIYKCGGVIAGFTRLITIVAKSFLLIGRVFDVILRLVINKCFICCYVNKSGLKAKRFPLHESDVDRFEGQVFVTFDAIRFGLAKRSSMDEGALVLNGGIPRTITFFYRKNGGLHIRAFM